MKKIKAVVVRILICVVLFFLANQLYKITFWKADLEKHARILNIQNAVVHNSDALYYGESSNFHKEVKDTIRYIISNILNDSLPEINIGTIDQAGIHARVYLSLINQIPEDSPVKTLIVSMNYRSFGADWRYAKMENYLTKTNRMLAKNLPIVNRFLASLKYYDYKTDAERNAQRMTAWRTETFHIPDFQFDNVVSWDSAMAWQTWLKTNPNLTIENIDLACHYIKNFAFTIDTLSNERIKDFDAIMEIAERRGYQVVFNLLGENMEEARKLVGDQLIFLMENNRKLLVEYYEKKGAIVVDNLSEVPDSCFVDRHWPTEHYNLTGKIIVAENIKHKLIEYAIASNH